MASRVIVVACHNTKDCPRWVHACVESAREWMPDERVVVVDNNSPDQSYIPEVGFWGADTILTGVNGFEMGAWWSAFSAFPEERFFFFLHDTNVLQADLTPYKRKPLTILGWLDNWMGTSSVHKVMIVDMINQTRYHMVEPFRGVMGSIFFCQRQVMERFLEMGMDRLLTLNKDAACAMERVLGMAFACDGYDVEGLSLGRGEDAYLREGSPVRKLRGSLIR